jgi:hypothetical protein
VRIGGVRDEVGGDMILKVVALELNIEEVAPMVIVVGIYVEVNWGKGATIGYSTCKRERSSHDGRGRGWSGGGGGGGVSRNGGGWLVGEVIGRGRGGGVGGPTMP